MQSVVVEKVTWQGLRGDAIFRTVTFGGKRHHINYSANISAALTGVLPNLPNMNPAFATQSLAL